MNAYEKALHALDAEFGARMRNLHSARPLIEAHEALSETLNAKGLNTRVHVTPYESGCLTRIEVLGNRSSNTRLVETLANWQWNTRPDTQGFEGFHWLIVRAPDKTEYTIYLPRSIDPLAIRRALATQEAAA